MSWEDRSGRINHEGPEYVWRQVADDLKADIDSGALPPNSRLPSGPELAQIYGVNRLTVIRAVNSLREEGVVVVLSGRGTYVVPTQ